MFENIFKKMLYNKKRLYLCAIDFKKKISDELSSYSRP